MPEPEHIPCHNCTLGTTSELNFLLNCCVCKRSFHHRCCKPPIPDEVLTSLINATLKKKPGKGVKFWKCYACREGIPPAPVQPGRQRSSASTSLLSKDEVIVISDDENGPQVDRDIVVSSRPPSQRKSRCETQQISSIPTLSGAGRSNDRRTHFPQNNDIEIDDTQGPPLPSTSRFGLLSPPISSSGSSVRHTSGTPFFENEERRSVGVELRLETAFPAQATLSTPPLSVRMSSPLVLKSSVLSTWAQPDIVDNDLRTLSKDFKEAYHRSIPVTQSATGQRKPRKFVAKQLDKNNRTPGQRPYCSFGTPS